MELDVDHSEHEDIQVELDVHHPKHEHVQKECYLHHSKPEDIQMELVINHHKHEDFQMEWPLKSKLVTVVVVYRNTTLQDNDRPLTSANTFCCLFTAAVDALKSPR